MSTAFARHVSYGLLTFMALAMMCIMAGQVSSTYDSGDRDFRRVASDIRSHILTQLMNNTNHGRQQSPPFEDLLRDVQNNLDYILTNGAQCSQSTAPIVNKQRSAAQVLQQLRKDFGQLDPKEGVDFGSRSTSRLTDILGRVSQTTNNSSTRLLRNIRSGISQSGSHQSMRAAYRHGTPNHDPTNTDSWQRSTQQNTVNQPNNGSTNQHRTPLRDLRTVPEHEEARSTGGSFMQRQSQRQHQNNQNAPGYLPNSSASPLPSQWPSRVGSPVNSYMQPHIPILGHGQPGMRATGYYNEFEMEAIPRNQIRRNTSSQTSTSRSNPHPYR